MIERSTLPPRPRWYLPAIVCTLLVIAALIVAAVTGVSGVDYTILGLLTSFLTVVLGGRVLATELDRRAAMHRLETDALDDLEPLRAASSVDYASRDAGGINTGR